MCGLWRPCLCVLDAHCLRTAETPKQELPFFRSKCHSACLVYWEELIIRISGLISISFWRLIILNIQKFIEIDLELSSFILVCDFNRWLRRDAFAFLRTASSLLSNTRLNRFRYTQSALFKGKDVDLTQIRLFGDFLPTQIGRRVLGVYLLVLRTDLMCGCWKFETRLWDWDPTSQDWDLHSRFCGRDGIRLRRQ